MKIVALIVTHNRLPLLQEAIAALQKQTLPVEILVVNNGSTDQTAQWLSRQPVQVITQQNEGASGGFFTGINQAYLQGADWIWAMDDDTIPSTTAVEKLLRVAEKCQQTSTQVGFLVSQANWIDGNSHLMNIPDFKTTSLSSLLPLSEMNIREVQSASFVSLLIARQAVATCGLPIREFFIWADDTEYTTRITRAGLAGIYVPESVVLHKTAFNYSADLYDAKPSEAIKHFYGIRNKLYCRRKWKGEFSFWRNILKHLFVFPFRIIHKRHDHRWKFILINWKATLAALFFNPSIQMPA